MEPKAIIQELLDHMKKVPHRPNFAKLQAYFLSLSKLRINANEAEFLVKGILDYLHMVINISANKGHREQTKICTQWLYPIQEIVTDTVRDVFLKRITRKMFDILLEEDVKGWCVKKELLKMFLICIKGASKQIRSQTVQELPNIYLFKLIDSLSTYGDVDFQVTLVETVFRIYGKRIVLSQVTDLIPESQELRISFANIKGGTFDEDVRDFLNILNKNSKKVFSIVCKDVLLGSVKCGQALENINGLWVDFNRSENVVSWYSINDFLDLSDPEWNLVSFFVSDVEVVQVFRPSNSKEVIIYFKLKEPCMSSLEDNSEWVQKAKDVKLIVQADTTKTNTLLRQVLPTMFRHKLHNDSAKVSLGQKPVYKPLKLSIHKRARSNLSVTKSDASSFIAKLDPVTSFRDSNVNSISSASTKCEFISISDSSTHSVESCIDLVSRPEPVPKNEPESQYDTAQLYPLEDLRESAKVSSATLFHDSTLSQERIQILSGRCSGTKARFSNNSQATSTPKEKTSKNRERSLPEDVRISRNGAGSSSSGNSNRYETAQETPQSFSNEVVVDGTACNNMVPNVLLVDVLASDDGMGLEAKPCSEKCSTSVKSNELPQGTVLVAEKTERRVLEELPLENNSNSAQFKGKLSPQDKENMQKQSMGDESERQGNKENFKEHIIRGSEEFLTLYDVERLISEDVGTEEKDGAGPQIEQLSVIPAELASLSDESDVVPNKTSWVKKLSSSSNAERDEKFADISQTTKGSERVLARRKSRVPVKIQRKRAKLVKKRKIKKPKPLRDEELTSESEETKNRVDRNEIAKESIPEQSVKSQDQRPVTPELKKRKIKKPKPLRDEELTSESEETKNRVDRKESIPEQSVKSQDQRPVTPELKKRKIKKPKPLRDEELTSESEETKNRVDRNEIAKESIPEPSVKSQDQRPVTPEPVLQQCVVLLSRHVGPEKSISENSPRDSEESVTGIENKTNAKQLSPVTDEEIGNKLSGTDNIAANCSSDNVEREKYARRLSASTIENDPEDLLENQLGCESAFDKLKENLNSILDEDLAKLSQETQAHTCGVEECNVIDECALKEKAGTPNEIVEQDFQFVSAKDVEMVRESEEEVVELQEETNQDATTIEGWSKQKLYSPTNVGYLENVVRVLKRREPESILEKTQDPKRVLRNPNKRKKMKALLNKSKKLKVVHPDAMLDIDINQNVSKKNSTFFNILDSCRKEVNTSFLDILSSTKAKNKATKTASRRTTAVNIKKTKPKSKKKFTGNRTVRDLTVSDVSEAIHDLRKDANAEDRTIFDPLSLSDDEKVEPVKKIQILSNIQIRPGRVMLDDKIPKEIRAAENLTNGVDAGIPSVSDSITNKEIYNWLETGSPNYIQIISERRIIMKTMYPVFKNILGKPDTTREYKDVQCIYKILKKYK